MRLDTVHVKTHRRMAAAVSAAICAVPAVAVVVLLSVMLVLIGGCS